MKIRKTVIALSLVMALIVSIMDMRMFFLNILFWMLPFFIIALIWVISNLKDTSK